MSNNKKEESPESKLMNIADHTFGSKLVDENNEKFTEYEDKILKFLSQARQSERAKVIEEVIEIAKDMMKENKSIVETLESEGFAKEEISIYLHRHNAIKDLKIKLTKLKEKL